MVGALLGGVGLFLLGMMLLTEGLQALAGERLRAALRRYTKTPLSAIATGGVATALVQSSSATTLAVIGFVGAGMLTFQQALGVVFGANLGTTTTAWLVAAVGLKVKVSAFALPLVGIGAGAKLFGSGRWATGGTAVAGFGLVFIGIDVLQGGMQGLSERVNPASFAGSGIGALLLLVAIGVVMTVVMQSSSAAVATTLAAVSAGTVTLEQAAALVIGQNVGTTVTAAVAAIGGSAAAKRTALAHVLFNVGTGAVALSALPLFVWGVEKATEGGDPALQLSAFHSAFNLLGVALFAPFIGGFARIIERWIPERSEALTRRLRVGQTTQPLVLLEAARATLNDVLVETVAVAHALLDGSASEREIASRATAIAGALATTRESVARVRSDPTAGYEHRLHVAVLHAIDHVHRMVEAFGETANAACARSQEPVKPLVSELTTTLDTAIAVLESPENDADRVQAHSTVIASARRASRPQLLEQTATGELTPEAALRVLEALRWADRIGYHLWRAVAHLEAAGHDAKDSPPPAPESEGRRGDETHDL